MYFPSLPVLTTHVEEAAPGDTWTTEDTPEPDTPCRPSDIDQRSAKRQVPSVARDPIFERASTSRSFSEAGSNLVASDNGRATAQYLSPFLALK
ncbi:hypothetical protein Q5P01_022956 [Channa striata]|uniref:Uncharacterized protein n=1 Tax=Channa striata TaxID=64152 RepID=A0AA88RWE8_CHASR|nr:hypothetical protein Q5P01_022956 [Channa striata]